MTFQDTLNRIRLGAELLFVAIVGLFWWFHRHPKPLPPSDKLPVEVRERISVDTRHKEVFVVTPAGTTKKTGVRHAQIDIGKDGSIAVRDRSLGFTFEPGIGLAFDGFYGRAAIDAQWGYFRHVGGLVGLSVPMVGHPRLDEVHLYPAVSYQLPFRWTPNTSVYIGSNVFKFLHSCEMGIRLAF